MPVLVDVVLVMLLAERKRNEVGRGGLVVHLFRFLRSYSWKTVFENGSEGRGKCPGLTFFFDAFRRGDSEVQLLEGVLYGQVHDGGEQYLVVDGVGFSWKGRGCEMRKCGSVVRYFSGS